MNEHVKKTMVAEYSKKTGFSILWEHLNSVRSSVAMDENFMLELTKIGEKETENGQSRNPSDVNTDLDIAVTLLPRDSLKGLQLKQFQQIAEALECWKRVSQIINDDESNDLVKFLNLHNMHHIRNYEEANKKWIKGNDACTLIGVHRFLVSYLHSKHFSDEIKNENSLMDIRITQASVSRDVQTLLEAVNKNLEKKQM